jgi:uncharacterized surface protein with fasciclin (FAS1) repeats
MLSALRKLSALFLLMTAPVLVVPTFAKQPAASPSIVQVALAVNAEGDYAGLFDTLIAALLAADPVVIETLSAKGQYTVFAPTDDAFAALGLTPANVGAALSQEELTAVLLYHVAPGRRDAVAVVDSTRIRTLSKQFVLQSGGVLTDGQGRLANIIVTDVMASNGIIHVIDSVLLPPGFGS